MPGSTYSSNLKIELMTTGENSGTWGDITNTNLGTALEQAVIGYGTVDYVSDANLTISITNTNAAQPARALVLNVTSGFGSLTATRELVVPTIQKQYIVQNNTTGGQSITVKTSAGTGITVPNGRKAHLYVDGTNVIQMFDFVDINGGTIDGATVGAASASTGAFTSLTASGATTLNGAVALGDASGDLITVPGTVNSNLLFTDATYDIGASGATRPRDLFLSRNLTVGGTLTLAGGVNLNGNVTVGDSSADTLTINSTITSNLIFTDATYDIGASGATRPRNLYLGGTVSRINNASSVSQILTSSGGSATLTLDAATGAGAFSPQILFSSSGTSKWAFGGGNIGSAGVNDLAIYDYTNTKLTYTVLAASGNMLMNTNLLFTDNTYNIGANGATRPANLFVAGSSSLGSYVGIGTVATSSYALDVQTDLGPQIRSLRPNNTLDGENYHVQYARGNGTGNVMTWTTTSNGSNGVKQLRLLNNATSSYNVIYSSDGYVSLGQSIAPATWVHVAGTNISGRGQMSIQSSASNVNPRLTWYYGGASPAYTLDIYGDTTNSLAVYDSASGYGHKWSVNGSTKLQLNTNAILAMNGAVADSWSTFTSGGILQLDEGNYVVGLTGNSTQIGSNGYFSGNWTYKAAAPAANINIDSSGATGVIYMRTAPVGTAGGNLSAAWNYNLTMFSNGSGTTGENSFGDSGQTGYSLYIKGKHTSGLGGVFFNSADTAYFCAQGGGSTDGSGIRMNYAGAEIGRVSIEPSANDFEFSTSRDYPFRFTNNNTARWRINASSGTGGTGSLVAESTGAGIMFKKSGALVNSLLDDYEYGTFAPYLSDLSGNSFSMTEALGSYVKVGRLVYIVAILSWNGKGSAIAGQGLQMRNLPFTIDSDSSNTRAMGMMGAWFATTTNWYTYNTYQGAGLTYVGFEGKNSLTAASATLLVSDATSAGSCRLNIVYEANS